MAGRNLKNIKKFSNDNSVDIFDNQDIDLLINATPSGTDINNDDIDLDLSDGSRFIIKKSKLINGIAAGNIKFNSFSGNIKPPKFIKPFDF